MAKGKGEIDPDVAAFSKDWRRLRDQKWRMRGGIEARMLLSLGLYFGEHGLVQTREGLQQRPIGTDGDANRLNLVFNMIRKAARRKMGRLWSVAPEFTASPNKIDPKAFDQADVVNDLMRGLDYKLKERLLHWQRVWWTVLAGVCVEHIPWVEDATEEPIPAYDPESGELLWREAQSGKIIPQSLVERLIKEAHFVPERFAPVEHMALIGDVGAQIISPFNFFIDAAVPTLSRLPPKGAVYVVECKTLDFVEDTFGADAAKKIQSNPGDDLGIVKSRLVDKGTPLASMALKDMIPAIQGSRAEADPPLCLVATRYETPCARYPHGRRHIFVPDQVMLDDDEIVYGQLPLEDIHYEAPTVSFWTSDFVTDLAPAQKFLNKRMSQMGEAANATIYELLLLGGELTSADIPSDMHGVVRDGLDERGGPRVAALQRGQLPQWFLESIRDVVNFIDSVGGSDLTQHKQFPGQIRGPLALPMLQELLDSEDGPFFSHLGEQLARIKQQRVNRVKQFYPPIRTLHYMSSSQKDELLVFHADNILRSGTSYEILVDQGSLMPELAAVRRARVIEDLSGPAAILYTDPRTGKLDAGKIAVAMKYTDRAVEDRQLQTRKLAQHLIARLWQGETLPPDVPYPFWDHSAILDELYAAMVTTEWLEASEPVKANFVQFYEKCRDYLAAIQQSQMDSVQSQMMQGAVAQATQQAAAKAASLAIDAAVGQIQAQAQTAVAMPPEQRQAQMLSRATPVPASMQVQ